ncbi:Alpha/Beta hydrolase protein [Nemania serpens]|nr:Alpha/Beta hydrolase protein [Nemania serpens]
MPIATHLSALLAAWSAVVVVRVSSLPTRSQSTTDTRAADSDLDLDLDLDPNLNFSIPSALTSSHLYGAPANDFSCRSSPPRNPVVMLHGLSASRDVDLNLLQRELNGRGYCTFSLTYGAPHAVPAWVGGLGDMRRSAAQIADFVREVRDRTTATGGARRRVDLVGHSEGGVQSLYVPLTQAGVAGILEHVVALGPAVRGATYFGFTDLWYIGGEATRALVGALADLLGCAACEQLAPGGLVTEAFAAAERIAQGGNKVTIITSAHDKLVPAAVSAVDEPGVRNVVVQTTCPDDGVGHAGLAWDKSVWRLVVNALEETDDEVYPCEMGLPF